jgi:nitrogen PTS system EIIA component
MTDDVLTIEQVAEYLRVSTKTIRRLVQRGELPGFQVGNQWRFRRALIEAWMEGQTVEKALDGGEA